MNKQKAKCQPQIDINVFNRLENNIDKLLLIIQNSNIDDRRTKKGS